MNKKEFIHNLATKMNITDKFAEQLFNAVFSELTNVIKSGDSFTVKDFGTFSQKYRAARVGRNPATGESMEIPAKAVPTFKPAPALKKAVNPE